MPSIFREKIPIQVTRDCVVASVQVDLSDEAINHLRTALLETIQQVRARAVVVDLSGLEIIDPFEFERLTKTLDMVRLMGAAPVISGLKPSIVASLIALDANVSGVQGAIDLDQAFMLIESSLEPEKVLEAEPSEPWRARAEVDPVDDERHTR
jgi:rsbT antagonist protein RsbS